MKTGWKIVLITAAVLAGIGVVLGAVSLLTGGSFEALADSPVSETLNRLAPAEILGFASSLFGG